VAGLHSYERISHFDVLDQTRLRPLIHESAWSTTPVDVKQGLAAFASFVFVFVCGVGFMVFG